MKIVLNNDSLFINIEGEYDIENINILKNKVFNILNEYEVENIFLNTKNAFLKGSGINSFIKEYKTNYDGKIVVNNR